MLAIDSTRISAMMDQMKSVLDRGPAGLTAPSQSLPGLSSSGSATRVDKPDFSALLQNHLQSLNAAQLDSKALGERFVAGDDTVALSDVMIASQKTGIAFQATVAVRNKLVNAYQEIMNMPV